MYWTLLLNPKRLITCSTGFGVGPEENELIDVGTRVMAPRDRGGRQVAEIENPGIPQDSQDSAGVSKPATPESKVEGKGIKPRKDRVFV